MKRTRILVSIVMAWALETLNALAAITIVNPNPANLQNNSLCPVGDGINNLIPSPVTYLAPGATPGLIPELTNGDTPFPGWTFQNGAALNGTLTVDIYKSGFLGNHFSGGEIEIRYQRVQTDPSNLRWVQLITTTNPLGGAVSPYIDPFPNDDNRPFYWTEAEDATHSNGNNGFGAYDKHFYDFSKRSHPPNSFVSWRADLYLASWDLNTPGVVTIHDGFRWGWNATCNTDSSFNISVPSHSDWSLIVLTLLLAGTAVWVVWKKRAMAKGGLA